jgi:hypothetical protein
MQPECSAAPGGYVHRCRARPWPYRLMHHLRFINRAWSISASRAAGHGIWALAPVRRRCASYAASAVGLLRRTGTRPFMGTPKGCPYEKSAFWSPEPERRARMGLTNRKDRRCS